MSQAALREARDQGEAFAGDLSWLGPGERDEISDRFARHHLRLRREMLAATVVRAEELREEYAHRYTRLRRRVTGLALTAFTLCAIAAILIGRL
ncbi:MULTISPECIES: hypothetical protein [unclassified Streptomyces]|uniref:hypothetical protein n=1 Tax=unclassified Streptomyces TaxID=2593676 RepID=UPI00366181A6